MSRSAETRFHSCNNRVETLRDEQYFKRWEELLNAATEAARRTGSAEVYHAAWKFSDVLFRGSGRSLGDLLREARSAGVTIFVRVSSLPSAFPKLAFARRLKREGIIDARIVARSHLYGSTHEKFTCFCFGGREVALVGSCDLNERRLDVVGHNGPRLSSRRPSHEIGVEVEGNVVRSLLEEFHDLRWRSRRPDVLPWQSMAAPSPPASAEYRHCISLVRTRPQSAGRPLRRSTASILEVADAVTCAIASARRYVYLEDQFFWMFDFGVRNGRSSRFAAAVRDATNRGTSFVALTSTAARHSWTHPGRALSYTRAWRALSAFELAEMARSIQPDHPYRPATIGCFQPVRCRGKAEGYIVHSKIILLDDEFMLLGSANVNERSWRVDNELLLGIYDPELRTVAELRRDLWAEHFGIEVTSLDSADIDASSAGRLWRDLQGATTGKASSVEVVMAPSSAWPVQWLGRLPLKLLRYIG